MSHESPPKFNTQIIPSQASSLWKSLERNVDAVEFYWSKEHIVPADLLAFLCSEPNRSTCVKQLLQDLPIRTSFCVGTFPDKQQDFNIIPKVFPCKPSVPNSALLLSSWLLQITAPIALDSKSWRCPAPRRGVCVPSRCHTNDR